MDGTHHHDPRNNLPRPHRMFNPFPTTDSGPFPFDQAVGPQSNPWSPLPTDTVRSPVSATAPRPGGSTMFATAERLPSLRSAFGNLATGSPDQRGVLTGQSTDPSSSAWSLLRPDQIPQLSSIGGQPHDEHTFPSQPLSSTPMNTTMEQQYPASSAPMQPSAGFPHGYIDPHPAPPWFLNPFLHPVAPQSARRLQASHGRNRSSRAFTSQGPPPQRPPPQEPASTHGSNSASHRHPHATSSATPSNTRRRSVRVIRDGRTMAELLPVGHPDLVRSRDTMSREQLERDVQIIRGAIRTQKVASATALRSLQSVDVKDLPEDEKMCMICYNKYGEESPEGINEAPLRLPNCKHVFGDHCLKRWLGESDHCPYCRDKLHSTLRPCASHPDYVQLFRARGLVLPSEQRRHFQDVIESAASPTDSDEADAYSSDNQASSTSLQQVTPRVRGERRPRPEDSENSLRRTRVRLSEDGSYSGRGSSRSSVRVMPPQHSSTYIRSSEGGAESASAREEFLTRRYAEAHRYINGTYAAGAPAPFRVRPDFQVDVATRDSTGVADASNLPPNPIQENGPDSRYAQALARNAARRYLPVLPNYSNRTSSGVNLMAALSNNNYQRQSAGDGMDQTEPGEQDGGAPFEPEYSDL